MGEDEPGQQGHRPEMDCSQGTSTGLEWVAQEKAKRDLPKDQQQKFFRTRMLRWTKALFAKAISIG